jgi:hypothetical protein
MNKFRLMAEDRIARAHCDRPTLFLIACAAFGILAITSAPGQTCAPRSSGLLAWYPGDNDTSDLTGAHNPSATNAITLVPAKVGNGLLFGTGGYVDIPQSAGLAPQNFTIDVWLRPDGPGPNNDGFGSTAFAKNINRLSGVQSSFLLGWIATTNRFELFAQSASFVSVNQYPPGQFYHVTATYDGATLKLYVNGVLDNQIALTDAIEYDSSVPYTIGSNFSGFRDIGYARTWNGVIDELQFFDRALSAAEIQAITDADSSGTCKVPSIISPTTATTVEGQQFTYQILTAIPPTSLAATSLPSGLTFDPALGVISGTAQAGSYDVGLTADNGSGTASATLRLTVEPAPPGPQIISGTSATGRVGTRFSFQVMTTNGSPNARLAADGLPPGLSADSASGLISGTPTSSGSFSVTLTVTDGSLTSSSTLQLTFVTDPALPVITSPNAAQLTSGQSFNYTIVAPGAGDASDPTTFELIGKLPVGLGFDSDTGTISGTYGGNPLRTDDPPEQKLSGGVITNVQLFATNSHGTTTSPLNFFSATVGTVNISTRLAIGTGDNVLIGGFIITGNAPKKVILRAVGPSLTANGAPVAGALSNPVLELHDGSGAVIGMNDDWRTAQEQEIIDTGIPPSDNRESAAVATLIPSNYTAIVSGKDDSTGIGLVEAYDLGTAGLDTSSAAKLAQISTRGYVQSGDNVMVGGFIVSGAATKIILRGIGPSLSAAGVANALSDPLLEVHDASGAVVASNDDWQSDPNAAEIQANGVAPNDPKESATYQVLGPGPYTAIIRGKDSSPGVALIEVYNL